MLLFKILSVCLLVVYVKTAPIDNHGYATSFSTFSQLPQHQGHYGSEAGLGGYSGYSFGGVQTPYQQSGHQVEDHYDHHPKYEFKYGVEDHHTGDIKSQHETRDGDVVKGEYSLHEPDGTILRVQYTADKHSGFNAVVHRTGHAKHPEHVAKAHVAYPTHHY